MEAVDALHFVFNLGLTLGVTAAQVSAAEKGYVYVVRSPYAGRCNDAVQALQTAALVMIDAMPWKTWKTYPTMGMSDLLSLIEGDFVTVLQAALNLCASAGLDRLAIVNMFCAKAEENGTRQINGY